MQEMIEAHGSPIQRLVHELPNGPWYTVQDVALEVGRSTDTLRKWLKDPNVPLSRRHAIELGPTRMRVYIFHERDLDAFRAYAKVVRPGKRPAQTAERYHAAIVSERVRARIEEERLFGR